MSTVTIKTIDVNTDYGEVNERVEVFVDDELIVTGWYGGEPEDNSRTRDYSWVEAAFATLAKKLGAVVKEEYEEIDEE